MSVRIYHLPFFSPVILFFSALFSSVGSPYMRDILNWIVSDLLELPVHISFGQNPNMVYVYAILGTALGLLVWRVCALFITNFSDEEDPSEPLRLTILGAGFCTALAFPVFTMVNTNLNMLSWEWLAPFFAVSVFLFIHGILGSALYIFIVLMRGGAEMDV